MKSILIPVEDHAAMESVLETALRLAERFGSYMEGVALGPDLAQITAADFSLGGIVFDERTRRELLDDAHDIFSHFMEKHGIGAEKANSSGPSFGWRGEILATDEAIGEYGRVFDIIAVGRPGLRHSAAAQIDARMGALRMRQAGVDRPASRAGKTRRAHRHRMERELRDRAHGRVRHAFAAQSAGCARDDGARNAPTRPRRKRNRRELADAMASRRARSLRKKAAKAPATQYSRRPTASAPTFWSKAAIRKAASAS